MPQPRFFEASEMPGKELTPLSLGLFRLGLPSDWTMSSMIFAGPPPEIDPEAPERYTFQKNLVVTLEALQEGMTLEEYLERQEQGLRNAHVAFHALGKPESVKLADGSEALLSEKIVFGVDNQPIAQMQTISKARNVMYTFILSQIEEAYETDREEFLQIALSFAPRRDAAVG